MFDYVRCEVSLPDGFTGELQCKDFDCTMSEVVIRCDGTLAVKRFEQEVVPQSERPYPDATDILSVIGMLRRINERWETIDYHGIMSFGGCQGRVGEPDYLWHEYKAKFTDGRLVNIKLVDEPA